MRKFLAALMLVACNAFALQPADVSITADPAVTVNVLPRKTEQPIMSITVNPQDHVMVNGNTKFPVNHHSGIVVADKSTWPTPQPGINTTLFYNEAWPLPAPSPQDWEADGAVRLVCNWSKMDFIDPIVYPGQTNIAHHHTFFGNTGVDQNTTTANIRNVGNATCRGGTINKTAYWVPSMIDTKHGNVPIAPKSLLLYYKTGNCSYNVGCGGPNTAYTNQPTAIQPIPHGLVLIAGDATRTTPGGPGSFFCMMPDGNERPGTHTNAIPTTCLAGDELWSKVDFPSCWDGKNVDSPDHKSHMAYNFNGDFVAGKQWHCPADHPISIPAVSYIVMYKLPADNDTSGWRLASDSYTGPAGYSSHADYLYGWDPTIADQWSNNCLAMRRNCGSTDIGDGRITQGFQGTE
jgi:hypothetical protein